ncbi:penicillin amidase family protein [Vulgatibacter incomptus]|uniref:Penicillin amidase family protein n=1 Tax=Vulgatibacter incomptus TaxID=1391653 RepID=A0A0K1PB29_9BACT|nr:penicillin amidase family protein [Vulgatibacter incomptus]
MVVLALASAALGFGCGDKDPAVQGTGGDVGAGGDGGAGGTGGTGGGAGESGSWSDTELKIPGLDGAVEVALDKQGILHAACSTDEDCVRVMGYFHAQNRFWQMDIQRRAARGRLSTLIGMLGIDQDKYMRLFMSTTAGEPIEEAIWSILDEETKTLLEAYSEGVNAWLADMRAGRNGAALTEEYKAPLVMGTPSSIPDWDPLDSVAFARLMTYMLSESSDVELSLAQAFPKLGSTPELAVDLFTLRPAVKSYTIPASGGTFPMKAPVDLEKIRALQDRLRPLESLFAAAQAASTVMTRWAPQGEPAGSNNWVVAPSKTTHGKALLANDPHLGLSNPSVWYFAEIDSKTKGTGTLHVAGGSFPGIPMIPIGRNETLTWGATVAYYDVTDVYVESLTTDGNGVLFDGGTVPLVRREHTFQVAGGAPVKVTLEWVPHHGPVIQKNPATGQAITVKWTGHEPTNELRAFLNLNRASTVAEGKEALKDFEVGAQNFVMADTQGNIGWYPHARVPNRPWASYEQANPFGSMPPWMPLPGGGSAEWQGFVPADQLPQLFNPPKGFIATANQDMTGATESGDPTSHGYPMLQDVVDPGFRHARIVHRLEAGGSAHDPAMMMDIQGDDYSLLGRTVLPHILAAADAAGTLSARAQTLVAALRDWNYTCPTGLAGHAPGSAPSDDEAERTAAIGCMAFHYTLPRVLDVAYGDKYAKAGLSVASFDASMSIRSLVIALERPTERLSGDALWNKLDGTVRSKDEVLVAGIEKAANDIVAPLGSDSSKWLWGRKHTLTFKTEISQLAPKLDIGPFATPGGQFTVNVANPGFDGLGFSHGAGASLRIVSEAGADGMITWMQLPGGQDLHRDGEHYGDLVEAWLENRSFILLFDRDSVAAKAPVRILATP